MGYDSEYDVLLDDFDEGLKTEAVREVFDELKRGLVPLIAEIAEHADRVDDSSLHGEIPIAEQRDFALVMLERFGFDHESWRLDPTVHPFAMSAGTTDIRLTTRYDESDLGVSLFASIHEFGHGYYEAGVDPALERTVLSSVTSMSLHESQSRMWENLVGRGLPAWRFFYPKLQEAFPGQFGKRRARRVLPRDQQGAAVAHPRRGGRGDVQPAHHPALRAGAADPVRRASARGPPEAWNARMAEYLGVEVPDDAHGVLQDVHWSGGAIGYFPTYALGNVISVQLWDQLRAELPDLDSQFEQGEFGELGNWLRENLHRHGRKYTSREMLERIVGGGMDPGPYLRYLREKLGEIYGLSVEAGAAVLERRRSTEEAVGRRAAALRPRRTSSFCVPLRRRNTTAGLGRLRRTSPG